MSKTTAVYTKVCLAFIIALQSIDVVFHAFFSSLPIAELVFSVSDDVHVAKRGYLTPSLARDHVVKVWEKEGKMCFPLWTSKDDILT